VDALLAEHVTAWGPLSAKKLEQAIDAIVDQVDPGALRRSRKASCQRDVEFGSPSDEAGFTSLWARLYAPDAVVLQQRVEQMARGVCEDDPRTLGERRSDALTAMAAGIAELACACGTTGCPAAARDATPPVGAVIHVVAQADTVEAARAENTTTTPPPDPTPPDTPMVDDSAPTFGPEPTTERDVDDPETAAEPAAEQAVPPPAFCPAPATARDDDEPAVIAEPDDDAAPIAPAPVAEHATPPPAFVPASVAELAGAPPAFVVGGGVLPAPLLGPIMGRASVREIRHPGDAPPEPHYRPSRELADFVRCRDLTCRWPGCDRPAYGCDIDHTVPYPVGPTHASNTKCYCRFHHLLKLSMADGPIGNCPTARKFLRDTAPHVA
jgi:hypothetical protein